MLAVAASADGQQMLASMLELRMWSPNVTAGRFTPFTAVLLGDEVLLTHAMHPPYNFSFSTQDLTGIGSVGERRLMADDGSGEQEGGGGGVGVGGDGARLVLRVLGRQLELRSSDVEVIRHWEEVFSERMELSQRVEDTDEGPWKQGRLRYRPAAREDDGGALGFATLSREGTLQYFDPPELSSADRLSGLSTPRLAVRLSDVLGVRQLGSYPDLELTADAGTRHVLQFTDDEEMLEWYALGRVSDRHGRSRPLHPQTPLLLHLLLVLLPAYKPQMEDPSPVVVTAADDDEPSSPPPMEGPPARRRSASAPVLEGRGSRDTSPGSSSDDSESPPRSPSPGSIDAMRRTHGNLPVGGSPTLGGREAHGDEMVMVGIVDVFVEGKRWVRCSAKMDDSNSLRLTSMEACAVDIHLAMSTTTSIHRGGSSWKSLRMKCRSAGETNEEMVTYIHPQGDDEMRRWLRVIHRATHVPLFKEEHASGRSSCTMGRAPTRRRGGPRRGPC